MGKINVLSFEVANLIAAGEVVDRPASVIKELLENAIDSGADRITVEIQNGGVSFMRVSDNGCGIEPDDLPVAVRRHATSKIKGAEDLDGILTLGFRGEALAAIAAVSDLRIISRPRGALTGAAISVSGGVIEGVTERGCGEGTTVIAENLFFNVPARRKFLKRDITEAAAVSAVIEKIALSRPDIAFTFISDGTVKMQTAGDGKLLSVIYALFGRDFSRGLIEVKYDYEGISISGYVGRSDNVKANRNGQNFFINRRYIRSKTATAALEQAFVSYIPQERFPVCVLNIEINPKAVDVNVHPAKLEVKFSNEKPVFEAIYYGVKNALENNITRPAVKVENFARIGQDDYRRLADPALTKSNDNVLKNAEIFTASPISKNAPENGGFIEKNIKDSSRLKPESEEQLELGKTVYLPQITEKNLYKPGFTRPKFSAEDYIESFKKRSSGNHEKGEKSSGKDEEAAKNASGIQPYVSKSSTSTYAPQENGFGDKLPERGDERAEVTVSIITENKDERDFSQAKAEPAACDARQNYRILGEGFNSYVIVEAGDKLLFIDKHAAHERLLFEKLKAGMKEAKISSQMLIVPIEFMMTSSEVLILCEYREDIEKIGFSFTAEKYTVRVSAVPEGIDHSTVADIFATIADRLQNSTGSAELERDMLFEKALYSAACKAAIKAGREYGAEHIEWLVSRLMELPDITFCPHGRPVAMEIKKSTLDRQFGRT